MLWDGLTEASFAVSDLDDSQIHVVCVYCGIGGGVYESTGCSSVVPSAKAMLGSDVGSTGDSCGAWVTAISAESVTICWNYLVGSDGYTVQYRRVSGVRTIDISKFAIEDVAGVVVYVVSENHLKIDGLVIGEEYDMSVWPRVGNLVSPHPWRVRGRPLRAPHEVWFENLRARYVDVCWQPSIVATEYRIECG